MAAMVRAEEMVGFKSARELRKLLDSVLAQVDADPVAGPRLRGAAAPLRLDFPALKLRVAIRAAEPASSHFLEWSFAKSAGPQPGLHLTMDSRVGNRFLQGRENPAIALVRGRMRAACGDTVAAIRFFPAAKPLFASYREMVKRDHPRLLLD
jgi:hypothetical protein